MQEHDRLRAQLQAMNLKLFWMRHNRGQLKDAMRRANQDIANGPNCCCVMCALSNRMHPEQKSRGRHCSFKGYFEAMLAECGLTYEKCRGARVGEVGAHEAADWIYANDAHFVFIFTDNEWRVFTYGAKLWHAKSHDDPELQKLARLFQLLNHDANDACAQA